MSYCRSRRLIYKQWLILVLINWWIKRNQALWREAGRPTDIADIGKFQRSANWIFLLLNGCLTEFCFCNFLLFTSLFAFEASFFWSGYNYCPSTKFRWPKQWITKELLRYRRTHLGTIPVEGSLKYYGSLYTSENKITEFYVQLCAKLFNLT